MESLGSGIEALQTEIATIKASLDKAVSQDDIDVINQDLEKVKEDLEKLLNQQSFTQGPINIRNQAELRYVKTLGDITNVRGGVTVNISTKSMYDSIAAVNKITSKINTIIAGNLNTTGHASGVLDFSALTFVDGDLTVKTKANKLDALTAVSENLNLDYNADYIFPNLASTGSITIKDYDKVTKVDFPALLTNDDGGTFQTGAEASVVSLAKATYVDLGGVQVRHLSAPEAVTVKMGFNGTLAGTTTITAAKATEITLGATKIGAHALTINGKADGTVHLNDLKEAGAGVTVSGATVNANALKTVTGTLSFPKAKTLTLPALEKADKINAAAATNFSAEKLGLTDTATLNAAAEVTLASTDDDLLATKDKVKTLTLKALDNEVEFEAAAFTVLETLNVMGKVPKEKDVAEGSQKNSVVANGAPKLKTVTLGGAIKEAELSGNAALESLTTAGSIITITVDANAKLKTITFGHSFLKGELANEVVVTTNAVLTAVDMTAVQKVKRIDISGNRKLTSIKVGSPETLAEPSATISYVIKDNLLPGKYTAANKGTETTQYSAPEIVQADLYALKLILEAYNKQESRGTSATFDLSFDQSLNDKGKYEGPSLIELLNKDTAAQNGLDGKSTHIDTDDVNKDNDTNNYTGTFSSTIGIDTARELALLKKE